MTTPAHVHVWQECEVGCEDCGSHPAVRCVAEDECPDGYDWPGVDLVYRDDPRDGRPQERGVI